MGASTKLFRIITELKLPPQEHERKQPGYKLAKALTIALPDDIRGWFIREVFGGRELSHLEMSCVCRWIYSDFQTGKIDLAKVARIREARVEQFNDYLIQFAPSQAVMVHVGENTLKEVYAIETYKWYMLEALSNSLKMDVPRIVVSIGLAKNKGVITGQDILWMEQITRPIPTYTQLMLIPPDEAFFSQEEGAID